MYKFEKLLVWQRAMSLVEMTYKLSLQVPMTEKYGLISQLHRSATLIPLNIAEGSANNNDKEFHRYLRIARGSLYESVTNLLLLQRIFNIDLAEVLQKCNQVGRLLNGLIKCLKANS